jgi:hypothetical protein
MKLNWINKLGGLYTWLLFFATLGLYGFLWFYETMNFINLHRGTEDYMSKKIMVNIAVFIAIVCLIEFGFVVQNLDKPFFQVLFMIFWFVNLGWILFISFAFYHLAKNIREIEENIGIQKVIKPVPAAMLFFLYFSSIIYVQEHIRRIENLAKC